ncbi:MAG: hypothetical protein IPK19_35925 [Chloroflexi bacterium]|nr:hypothetical protein [Chloroflexota bacterium]
MGGQRIAFSGDLIAAPGKGVEPLGHPMDAQRRVKASRLASSRCSTSMIAPRRTGCRFLHGAPMIEPIVAIDLLADRLSSSAVSAGITCACTNCASGLIRSSPLIC